MIQVLNIVLNIWRHEIKEMSQEVRHVLYTVQVESEVIVLYTFVTNDIDAVKSSQGLVRNVAIIIITCQNFKSNCSAVI